MKKRDKQDIMEGIAAEIAIMEQAIALVPALKKLAIKQHGKRIDKFMSKVKTVSTKLMLTMRHNSFNLYLPMTAWTEAVWLVSVPIALVADPIEIGIVDYDILPEYDIRLNGEQLNSLLDNSKEKMTAEIAQLRSNLQDLREIHDRYNWLSKEIQDFNQIVHNRVQILCGFDLQS